MMLLPDLLVLGIVVAAAVVAGVNRNSHRLRCLATVGLLIAALYGVVGLSLLQRLAWYTPERTRYLAYSDSEKQRFSEGAEAAQQQARRFLPVMIGSVTVLAGIVFRRR